MKHKGLFITGTDTDVGKSFVSAFVRQVLLQMGIESLYYKPLQCGPGNLGGQILPGGDAELQNTIHDCGPTLCSYCLETPASPHFALAQQKEVFALGQYKDTLSLMAQQYPFTVIEGAGGVRVPIDAQLEMSDLAKLSNYPVLLVARPDLGTINHTLLSIEHLQRKQIPLMGFCFSIPRADLEITSLITNNYQTIVERTGVNFMGMVPFWNSGWTAADLSSHPLHQYLHAVV